MQVLLKVCSIFMVAHKFTYWDCDPTCRNLDEGCLITYSNNTFQNICTNNCTHLASPKAVCITKSTHQGGKDLLSYKNGSCLGWLTALFGIVSLMFGVFTGLALTLRKKPTNASGWP